MDYLAYHQQRPLTSRIDISQSSLETIANNYSTLPGVLAAGTIYPENLAIFFYMMNHAVAEISFRVHQYEPLSIDMQGLVDEYYTTMSRESLRVFYYLLLICTRESRHVKNLPFLSALAHYGVMEFNESIKGCGSGEAVSTFLNHPPQTTLGSYVNHLHDVFFYGQYSGGFGGKKWASVAKVLRDFVHGDITAEMMLDIVFTLCHNNGPIFNKGILFHCHDTDQLAKILDVQRAGQIPQLVRTKAVSRVNTAHREWQKKAESVLGVPGLTYIDWFAVEKLGALHGYAGEKAAQVSKHGVPAADAAAYKAQKLKQKQKAEKEAEKAAAFYEVMPGVHVKKIKRGEF